MIAGVSGDGGLGIGVLVSRSVMRSSAARRCRVAATSDAGSPGRMRQLMVTRADWGSAFEEGPGHLVQLDRELVLGEAFQHRREPVDGIVGGAREGAVAALVGRF